MKHYVAPASQVITCESENMMISASLTSAPAKDNVQFESSKHGWDSSNWSSNEP